MNQQLIGEQIDVFMRDSVIDHAHVINQAFSIEQLPKEDCFNQVSSREMLAFFIEGQIHEAQAKDNVLTVYYPEDKADSSYVGLIYMETSQLRMFLEKGKLSSIWAPKSEGTMYPMSQIPPNRRRLDGFAWFDYIRPLSKDDIYEWRPKKKGTELVPQRQRTPARSNAPANAADASANAGDAPAIAADAPANADDTPTDTADTPANADDAETPPVQP